MAATKPDGASPAMAQWFALKAEHPDALLFFRMGDFFEMFFDDAQAAASALDIALTHRGEHAGAPIPMCGVPVSTSDIYLARLIRRGFRVAIAEQMEAASARTGKGPLKRDVVRLITPGTLTEDSLLDATRPNLLLALATARPAATAGPAAATLGAAWLDVSTGLFETAELSPAGLPALLGRLDPAEILAADEVPLADWSPRRAPALAPRPARRRPPSAGRSVRRRQPGRLWQLHRRRGQRRRSGTGLRPPHPGRPHAATVPPGAGRPVRRDGDGRGHPRQPGTTARA